MTSYLIDTLYYTLRVPYPKLVFIPATIPDPEYAGIQVIPLTDSAFNPQPDCKATFIGYRIPANPSYGFVESQYLQQYTTVQTPSGALTMTSLYGDPGKTLVTTISGANYVVINGLGIYANAKRAYVAIDNVNLTRTISVYGHP